MLALEPILWCWKHDTGKDFDEHCKEEEGLRFAYTLVSMLAMFLYYILLFDLTVVSTRISAFVLVCVRMLSELGLFLGALFGCLLTFSSAISVIKHDTAHFAGIDKGAYALFRQITGTFGSKAYKELEKEPTVLATIFVFWISTVILLLNLLIAQLSCAYSAVYDDMVGFARLERAEVIVEMMPSVPTGRWSRFVDSLKLHRPCEFNEGDRGPRGAIQVKEAASLNPTSVDSIRRYGGSTNLTAQFPVDDDDQDVNGEDRFEKVEKVIAKTLQKLQSTANAHSRKAQKSGSVGGSGTGSALQSGSHEEGSQDSVFEE